MKKKEEFSENRGTTDFGSTAKMEVKSSNAGLLMENFGLSLEHRKLKTGKDSLRFDDVTKSPPPFP